MMVDYNNGFKTIGQAAWNKASVHLVIIGTFLCFLLGSCRRMDDNVKIKDSMLTLAQQDRDIGFKVDLSSIREQVDFIQKMIKGRKEKGERILGLISLLNAINQLSDGSQHSRGMVGYSRRIVDAAHPMHALLGVGVTLFGLSAITGYFGSYFGPYPEQHLLNYTAELCSYPPVPGNCSSSCNGSLFLQTSGRSYGYNWTCNGADKFKEVPLIAFDTALKVCREGCQQLYKSFGNWINGSPNASAICNTFDIDVGLFKASWEGGSGVTFERGITLYPNEVKDYSDKINACDIFSRETLSRLNNHIYDENNHKAYIPWSIAIEGAVTTMIACIPYVKAWWKIAQLDKRMALWNGRSDLLDTNMGDIEEQLRDVMQQGDSHRLTEIVNKVAQLWEGIRDLLELKLALISSNTANLDVRAIQSLHHELTLLSAHLHKLKRRAIEAYMPKILGGQKEGNTGFKPLNLLLFRSKWILESMCDMLDEIVEKTQKRINH